VDRTEINRRDRSINRENSIRSNYFATNCDALLIECALSSSLLTEMFAIFANSPRFSALIIVIYRYASSLVRQRDAARSDDPRAEKRREMASTRPAECLLFGRAVDRLYLRSGLSLSLSLSSARELNLNGKEERATSKRPASHDGVTAATRRGIYNRARSLFVLY